LLGWMCPDGTQCRQGSQEAPDATRCGVLVQDTQDAQDAGSRLGESGRKSTGSDAGHLFTDVGKGSYQAGLEECSDEKAGNDLCKSFKQ